ncbi:MAG TPA: shikimate kinase [Chthonomonadaceae bacterium]|nr:shikimate kinase [Chthonomonadaceae bacterium]
MTARTILLLGPNRAGKTTIGTLLSERLGIPFRRLGELAPDYWHEIGGSKELAQKAWDQGWDTGFTTMQPWNAHALERALAEHTNGILAVGPFEYIYEEAALLERVRALLQPYELVILLQPSPDVDESVRILEERGFIRIDGAEINDHFVRHHSNHDLAKYVFYTQGKTPEQTCDEILTRLDDIASDIILIGPIGAGKSTIGKLLAERLGLPEVAMDHLRWDYYKEIGWSEETQRQIGKQEGLAGVLRYWKPFEIYAVERLLADHCNCVIHFGAGHSVYEDEAAFARARELLAPYPNVVLLLPSPDLDESVEILRDRGRLKLRGMVADRFFLTHPASQLLPKLVIYTQDKTPEATVEEILRLPAMRGDAPGR